MFGLKDLGLGSASIVWDVWVAIVADARTGRVGSRMWEEEMARLSSLLSDGFR